MRLIFKSSVFAGMPSVAAAFGDRRFNDFPLVPEQAAGEISANVAGYSPWNQPCLIDRKDR